MPLFFAGLSSLMFGIGDFAGGMATRKAPVHSVVIISQMFGMALILVVIPFFAATDVDVADFAWGAGSGVFGAVGLALLFYALATQPNATVAAVTALVSALVPVLFGLVTAERPGGLGLIGIAIALPAIYLVSRGSDRSHSMGIAPTAVILGTAAGIGFGLFFILISRTGDGAGMWPLVAARLASLAAMTAFAVSTRQAIRPPRDAMGLVVTTGLLDMGANIFFLLAVRDELLALVAVMSSLYPVVTIILARVILSEKMRPAQGVGVALAVAGVVLIGLG